jgi:hypothetical protein
MNLDADTGGRDKQVVMVSNSPIATLAMPIAVVMVVPVSIIPVVIETINVPIFMVTMMMIIGALVIATRRE